MIQAETQLVRDTARDLLRSQATIAAKLAAESSPNGFDTALWRRMADLGWLEAACTADTASVATLGVLAEELGRAGLASPMLKTMQAARTLACHGDGSPASAQLGEIGAGRIIAAVAGDEPGQPPVMAQRMPGGGLRLADQARVVEWAAQARFLLVHARIESGDRIAAIIPTDTPGLSIAPVQPFDSGRAALVSFAGVGCPPATILNADPGRLGETIAIGHLLSAAEAVGGAEGALDAIVAFVCEREQFGRKIASFQAIQHGLADVKTLVDGASLAAWEGLSLAAAGQPAEAAAALALWSAQRAFQEAAIKGALYHGGMGHTRDSAMQFYYRRAGTTHARFGGAWDLLDGLAAHFVDPRLDAVVD